MAETAILENDGSPTVQRELAEPVLSASEQLSRGESELAQTLLEKIKSGQNLNTLEEAQFHALVAQGFITNPGDQEWVVAEKNADEAEAKAKNDALVEEEKKKEEEEAKEASETWPTAEDTTNSKKLIVYRDWDNIVEVIEMGPAPKQAGVSVTEDITIIETTTPAATNLTVVHDSKDAVALAVDPNAPQTSEVSTETVPPTPKITDLQANAAKLITEYLGYGFTEVATTDKARNNVSTLASGSNEKSLEDNASSIVKQAVLSTIEGDNPFETALKNANFTAPKLAFANLSAAGVWPNIDNFTPSAGGVGQSAAASVAPTT